MSDALCVKSVAQGRVSEKLGVVELAKQPLHMLEDPGDDERER